MDAQRVGRGLRAIRTRANLTQKLVAERAHVPRAVIARVERGDMGRVSVGQLLAIAGALHANVGIGLHWNGADLDRLLNAGHSGMHELVVGILTTAGWEVVPECSFSIWGERGIIDILAWHAPSRTLLVVELKTEIVEVQRLIGSEDRYRRASLPRSRAGSRGSRSPSASGSRSPESSTNHRRLSAHARVLRAAFPSDGRRVHGWLPDPSGPLRALSFLSDERVAHRTAARSSRRRFRPASGPLPELAAGAEPDHRLRRASM